MTGAGPLTLGTAGHIDHGKTALIRALTGVDTDRLAEERARGISIELGYARLELPSGRRLSVIDVPGHERFVRTMVAGATGIDLFLMTIAADDGVMPQTREHAAVLRALGVDAGVVAVTKSDLADPEVAALAGGRAAPRRRGRPRLARTGRRTRRAPRALERAAEGAQPRRGRPAPPGCTSTGCSPSGARERSSPARCGRGDRTGDEHRALAAGRRARVRGVQVHDGRSTRRSAGQRVAVNLDGVAGRTSRAATCSRARARLGDVSASTRALELADGDPRTGDAGPGPPRDPRVAGAAAWLGGRFWQVRLEQPLIAAAGDRVVVRQIAPPDTLGGGVVLDAHPRSHGPSRDCRAAEPARER